MIVTIPGGLQGVAADAGFTPHRDNCYWESEEKRSWSEAERDCQSKGGHLVSITDWTEQAYAFSSLASQSAWIGISDVDVSGLKST